MFSAFNVLRQQTMRFLDVDTFEFSQAFGMFYDKLEKANATLERIIDTAELPTGIRRHVLDARNDPEPAPADAPAASAQGAAYASRPDGTPVPDQHAAPAPWPTGASPSTAPAPGRHAAPAPPEPPAPPSDNQFATTVINPEEEQA